jgi:hypothetical protein
MRSEGWWFKSGLHSKYKNGTLVVLFLYFGNGFESLGVGVFVNTPFRKLFKTEGFEGAREASDVRFQLVHPKL